MGNCVTDWIFRRQRFCCCLPARLGAGLLALLTLLLSGLLMIILWYEVATNWYLSDKEKTAYVLAGVLETFLFIASFLGFVGVCARKQSFVVIHVTFLYVHFFINLGVAAYFLWMITHAANEDIVKLCEEGIPSQQGQGQCKGLLNITKGVFWGISLLVLSIEAYCTIVVTRYVNQLRYEKRDVRRIRREQRESAYEAFHARFSSVQDVQDKNKHYSYLSGSTVVHRDEEYNDSDDVEMGEDKEALLNAPKVTVFDPYAAYEPHRSTSPTASPTSSIVGFARSRVGDRNRSKSPASASVNGSYDARSVERHRSEAERQLTGGSTNTNTTAHNGGKGEGMSVSVGAERRGRSSAVVTSLALPPGAAPAIPPTVPRSRESSVMPIPTPTLSGSESPPPGYAK